MLGKAKINAGKYMAIKKGIFNKKTLFVLMSMIVCNAYAYPENQTQSSASTQSTSQNQTQSQTQNQSSSTTQNQSQTTGGCSSQNPKCNGSGILFAPAQPMPMPDTSLNAADSSSPQYCSIWDWMSQTKFTGFLRNYYFNRMYNRTGGPPNQSALSFGGMINAQTAPIYGVSADAAVYTAQPFGLNSKNPAEVDTTLPGVPLTALGQAYLQYQNPQLLVRGGYQIIKTPWITDSDARMIPATYEAGLGTYTPIPDLSFTAMRVIGFKSRIDDWYPDTNLYFLSVPQLANIDNTGGTIAVGSNYKYEDLKLQAWYYEFYNFGNLLYGDASFVYKNCTKINPLIALQAGSETGDGKNYLEEVNLGETDARLLGGQAGAEIYDGKLTFGYDYIPRVSDAFQDGDIVSPYTASYASDPLYTTSMIAGLIEKASGQAWKVTGSYNFFQTFLLSASYAKYYTEPFVPDTNEGDIDGTYSFHGWLKGFSVRDRIGILNGIPRFGRFVYNRVMLQYNF